MSNPNNLVQTICPSCGTQEPEIFYEIKDVPVQSVLLLHNEEEALTFPRGDLVLGFCHKCGFISNLAFDPSRLEYSTRYESTQAYSNTFNAYQRGLVERLVERYDLQGKDIIEIGCGQGEFLYLLCEMGENRGIGFDPVYDSSRSPNGKMGREQLAFIKDFYSEKYAQLPCDFLCCKMTLEHIADPASFMQMVRRSIGDHLNTVVFFQVPDTERILRELAFWDVYYEHCSYFSLGSLESLFRRSGFKVIEVEKEYEDQYLIITARPTNITANFSEAEEYLQLMAKDVANFSENCRIELAYWRKRLDDMLQEGRKLVVWGASSKTVSFFNVLNIRNEIKYAVDINPLKHGTFIAGSGQQIVSPEFLIKYQPDTVIVMNPVYCDEIQCMLDRMEVPAQLISV